MGDWESLHDFLIRRGETYQINSDGTMICLRRSLGAFLETLVARSADPDIRIVPHSKILHDYSFFQGTERSSSYYIIHELRIALGEPLRNRIITHRNRGYSYSNPDLVSHICANDAGSAPSHYEEPVPYKGPCENPEALIQRLTESVHMAMQNYTWWADEDNPWMEQGSYGGDWDVLMEIADGTYKGIPDQYIERASLMVKVKDEALRWSEERAYKAHDATIADRWDPSKSLEQNLEQVGPSYREEIRSDVGMIYRSQTGVHQLLLLKIELEQALVTYLEKGEITQLG